VGDAAHAWFLLFCEGGVSSIVFLITARQSDYFSNTGDVSRRLCRRLSLSTTQPSTTRTLITLWATTSTRDFI